MNKAKLPSCLRKYSDLIESVSDERDSEDGYWVYLAVGWRDCDGTHCIHEESPEECSFWMSSIERCTEPGCCSGQPKTPATPPKNPAARRINKTARDD